MKIVHVIVGLNAGGAELMLKRLVETQIASSSEYQHAVVSLTDLGEIGPLLREQQIPVTALGMKNVLGIPVTLWRLYKMLRREKPDVVHTWMYHADLLGGLAARLAGISGVIWGVRTTDLERGGKASVLWVRRACSKLSAIVPRFIVCAANASRDAHIAIGYDSAKMLVISNGFDLSRLSVRAGERDAIRNVAGLTPAHLVVGSLGRFSPVKDHATFIAAAGLLAKKFPSLRFMLVGRELDAANVQLAGMLQSTGCPERFVLLGQRDDVPACLSAMDIFCLHSLTEGFPNVLGEAMTMGLPCVTTDVGDAGYLLADPDLVVPRQDPQALASVLATVIEAGDERRQALGAAARVRVEENFTMTVAAKRFAALYHQVLAARKA